MAIAIEKPRRLKRRTVDAMVRRLKRHANGDWTVTVRAKVHVELVDGRQVVADRDVHIRARQIGRKNGQ
jgi:hypothetical protein